MRAKSAHTKRFLAFLVIFALVLTLASGCTLFRGRGAKQEQEVDPAAVKRGRELYTSLGCNGCHSLDGTPSAGPTWQGLWGRQEELQDGTTVTVDENYLRESIRQPNAKLVRGYDAIMPAFTQLSDEDVDALIAFIKSLKEK